MYDTHTPAEWLGYACLGVSAISLIGLALAFADADAAYFDPRPLLGQARDRVLVAAMDRARLLARAAVQSDAVYPLLRGWSNTKCDVREIPTEARAFASDARLYARLFLRDYAFTATALLAFLTINPGDAR